MFEIKIGKLYRTTTSKYGAMFDEGGFLAGTPLVDKQEVLLALTRPFRRLHYPTPGNPRKSKIIWSCRFLYKNQVMEFAHYHYDKYVVYHQWLENILEPLEKPGD